MFLNRLEIVGFKSFAERVKVEFNEGITAVVGPNGSGKSNIIDAVRWVLGEQSARSLRGQRMEDIIFQGSDTRSALNFAEVSLILNNQAGQLPVDYQEVNVTRRVYRSGESDFYINKQACRLKDIVDLFTDTGLGKESFSIIGQGKIDEILSSKAEERRAIFEEAAGVLKYKQRKIKAEFKLNETKENLLRVEDIVHEINTQLTPLEKQAEKAKAYHRYKEELKRVEVALLVTEIESLHAKWQALLEEIEKEKANEVAVITQMRHEESIIITKQEKLHELERDMTNLQNSLVEWTEKVEQSEGKRNVLLERQKHLQENKENMTKNKQVIVGRINQLEQEINREEEKTKAIQEEKETIDEQINGIQHLIEHGVEEIQEEIEQLKADYIDYLNEQAVKQNNVQTLAKRKEQLQVQKNKERKSYQSILQDNETFLAEKLRLEEEVKALAQDLTNAELAYEEWKNQIQAERLTLEDMQKKLYAGNEQIARLKARKETLEEMKESFQGYFFSVKEILRAHQDGKIEHIHGAVIDLMSVPEQYITAIDTVLGAQAQHVVCENDQAARNAIAWLKQANKGRATFLPIASLTERHIGGDLVRKIQDLDGFVAIASDIVTTESRYEKVIKHVMGNVIIASNIQAATKIAQITNRRFRVVTLDGDVVYPGGSISGGARKTSNQSSLFTREKELVTLTEKIHSFEAREANFAEKVHVKTVEVEQLIANETSLLQKVDEYNKQLQGKQQKLQAMMIQAKSIENDLSVYDIQMDSFTSEEKEVNQAIDQNNLALQDIQAKIQTVQQTIADLTKQEQAFQEQKQAKATELHSLEKKQVELRERLKNMTERTKELNRTYSSLKNEHATIQNELEEIEAMEKTAIRAEEIEAQIQDEKTARDQATIKLAEKRHERQIISQEIDDITTELKAKEKIYQEKQKQIQAQEVQANRLDVILENHLNHLQTEYVTTFERASKTYERIEHMEEAKQAVKQLKAQIEGLGTVNLGAIEEYERLVERYEFLETQKNDLLEAKATLYAVIEEMDEEMKKRFSDLFSQVQIAFSDVFKKLFGGGHAELLMTDKDDILGTGIEIIASPPGKKQKALSLLSGGERALTAIALLFAILRVKPVPFCILDEVDASLDEANVARFSHYLNHYSDGTQFIVITHRKGTMEEANVLYGVTMQESGVSRLVSVRLEDAEDFAEIL